MKQTIALLPLLAVLGCGTAPDTETTTNTEAEEARTTASIPDSLFWNADSLLEPIERKHFEHLRKITWGGDNAEAYWSFDGQKLVFQATVPDWGSKCDQIYTFNPFTDDLQDNKPLQLSLNGGRTTCSYFLPGDTTVLFASTHLDSKDCPPLPPRDPKGRYIWPIYPSFEIFVSDLEGNILQQLTDTPGYNAEATVSPKGDRIVFTSTRNGDLDLYTRNIDGSDVKQVTHELGYDGGAFFSPDGTKLVWRASRPKTEEEITEYKDLLEQGMVMPTNMELYIANADGSDQRQITSLGQANWAPYWHPDGKRIIFASNHKSERGFPFTLFMIDTDGNNLEQLTETDMFDAFPVFSADGKYLVFSSNRAGVDNETNLFMAKWKE